MLRPYGPAGTGERAKYGFLAVKVDVQEKSQGGILLTETEKDRSEGTLVAKYRGSDYEIGKRVKLQLHRGVPFKVTEEIRKGHEEYLDVGDWVLLVREDKIFGYLDD